MRNSEFKRKYDPVLGYYVKKHIYGKGIMDVFRSIGSKLFGKTTKDIMKKGIQACHSLFTQNK